MNANWHNVSRREPCPICHKPDWCTVSNDGAVCVCRRVESAKPCKSGTGWIHWLTKNEELGIRNEWRGQRPQPSTFNLQPSTFNFSSLHASFDGDPYMQDGLALSLGLGFESFAALDVRYNHAKECMSFPMRDVDGNITGLRYRHLTTGKKWSERGSRDGLFYSLSMLAGDSGGMTCGSNSGRGDEGACRRGVLAHTLARPNGFACGECSLRKLRFLRCISSGNDTQHNVSGEFPFPNAARTPRLRGEVERLFITEGPTDTAAAISMGLNAVGRSSCMSGVELIKEFVRKHRVKSATIIADGDQPGWSGAKRLAAALPIPTKVTMPPPGYKDLRDWYRRGAGGEIRDKR